MDTELDDSAFYQEPELDNTLNKSGGENKSDGEGHVESDVRSNDGVSSDPASLAISLRGGGGAADRHRERTQNPHVVCAFLPLLPPIYI
jgi:hypothetical protein